VADFEYTIHGPMWQYKCESCHAMGDCWDTEQEAIDDMNDHDCITYWKSRIPPSVLEELINQRKHDD
jgi:predicted dithiol-disulfide oxidoreductase (DUF899 family)